MSKTWTKDDILDDRRYCRLLNKQFARLGVGMKASPRTGRQARTGCEDILVTGATPWMAATIVIKGGQGFAGEDFYSEREKYLQDLIRR